MKVRTVIKTYDTDGYYSADVYAINTEDSEIAKYMGISLEELTEKYEITDTEVVNLK